MWSGALELSRAQGDPELSSILPVGMRDGVFPVSLHLACTHSPATRSDVRVLRTQLVQENAAARLAWCNLRIPLGTHDQDCIESPRTKC